MKTRLIKLSETHYIIVDDSPIKEGDYCFIQKNHFVNSGIGQYNQKRAEGHGISYTPNGYNFFHKITHSTEAFTQAAPRTLDDLGICYIPLADIEEAIYGYSVKKSLSDLLNKDENLFSMVDKRSYKLGFKAHQELVKDKKYTEEDIKRAYLQGGFDSNALARTLHKEIPSFNSLEDYLQSIQPKTEWDVEFVDGKLKLI